ncbi:MAG TPA: hypothetical protein VK149_12115 [Sideroxyarcus sp.]|nr:hypothetical protein [Sideroxyarcus sp.]
MKYLAIIALLYSSAATPVSDKREWWQEFGSCTKTDISERGICGDLKVRSKPLWRVE